MLETIKLGNNKKNVNNINVLMTVMMMILMMMKSRMMNKPDNKLIQINRLQSAFKSVYWLCQNNIE